MAGPAIVGYQAGITQLHTLDARFKLAILAAVSLTSINAGIWGLSLLLVLLHLCFPIIRLSIRKTVREIRFFLFLILLVFLTRALFTPGDMLIELIGISISRQGVSSGIIFSWRLWLILMSGILFVNTSKISDIKAAVQWFLKPIPLIPEKKVGVILSLMIRFLPFIMEKAREISEAQKARGVGLRKNPVYRIRVYILPLLRSLFENADKLVIAMEARCFNPDRSDPELTARKKDWLIMISTLSICITALQL